jgi:hypothetical protein
MVADVNNGPVGRDPRAVVAGKVDNLCGASDIGRTGLTAIDGGNGDLGRTEGFVDQNDYNLSHKCIAPALGRFLHVLSELPVAGSSYIFFANWLAASACHRGCPSDTGITFRYRTLSQRRLRSAK